MYVGAGPQRKLSAKELMLSHPTSHAAEPGKKLYTIQSHFYKILEKEN